MSRPTRIEEREYDRSYQRKCGWLHRIVVWLARKHINRVVKTVLSRAYERSQIDSHTMHEMGGCCDSILWPERRKTKLEELEKILREPNDKYTIEVQRDGSIRAVENKPYNEKLRQDAPANPKS